MEKFINKSSLDITSFLHFGFILSIFLLLSFVAFDLNKLDERSFVFALLLFMWLAYSAGSDKISAFEFEKTTDYTSSSAFAGICLCWWVALTDYFLIIEQTSRFTGFFLAFALLLTLGMIADFIHYFSDKAKKNIAPWYVVRPGQMLLLITLGAMLYFFIYGSWAFHIGSPFEFLSRVIRDY